MRLDRSLCNCVCWKWNEVKWNEMSENAFRAILVWVGRSWMRFLHFHRRVKSRKKVESRKEECYNEKHEWIINNAWITRQYIRICAFIGMCIFLNKGNQTFRSLPIVFADMLLQVKPMYLLLWSIRWIVPIIISSYMIEPHTTSVMVIIYRLITIDQSITQSNKKNFGI